MNWKIFRQRSVTYTPTLRTSVHPPEPPPAVLPVHKIQVTEGMSHDELKKIVLPEGARVDPGPLPVEAQIILRVMGEDLATADELIKGMRPVDRAVLVFYADEIHNRVNKINEDEGRY
jgi:hypothetical protein